MRMSRSHTIVLTFRASPDPSPECPTAFYTASGTTLKYWPVSHWCKLGESAAGKTDSGPPIRPAELGEATMDETHVNKATSLTSREWWWAVITIGTTAVVFLGGLYVLGLWVDRWD